MPISYDHIMSLKTEGTESSYSDKETMLYALGIVSTFWAPWFALLLYAAVAVMWLVPDRRIEGVLPGVRGGQGPAAEE